MSGEKRTAQISPDRLSIGFFAISLVVIVMSSSMVFSYVGIAEAAAWTGVPSGIHLIAPIFIDGAIITYTVSLTIFEWRREGPKTIRHTKRVLRGFTLLSVVLNFAHTASFWQWNFTAYEAWFGSLISISAPVAALLSAEEVVRLAFRRRRVTEERDAPGVEPLAEAVGPAPAAMVPASATAAVTPALPVPEPEPVDEPAPSLVDEERSVIEEAERVLNREGQDDGIVRYPVQGEVLLTAMHADDMNRPV